MPMPKSCLRYVLLGYAIFNGLMDGTPIFDLGELAPLLLV